MPKYDDFQILEGVRLNAQDRQLKYPPKRHVAKREEHETSEPDAYSMGSASERLYVAHGVQNAKSDSCTLHDRRAPWRHRLSVERARCRDDVQDRLANRVAPTW